MRICTPVLKTTEKLLTITGVYRLAGNELECFRFSMYSPGQITYIVLSTIPIVIFREITHSDSSYALQYTNHSLARALWVDNPCLFEALL